MRKMICSQCQTELPGEAGFCWKCGAPQSALMKPPFAEPEPYQAPYVPPRGSATVEVVDGSYRELPGEFEPPHSPVAEVEDFPEPMNRRQKGVATGQVLVLVSDHTSISAIAGLASFDDYVYQYKARIRQEGRGLRWRKNLPRRWGALFLGVVPGRYILNPDIETIKSPYYILKRSDAHRYIVEVRAGDELVIDLSRGEYVQVQ